MEQPVGKITATISWVSLRFKDPREAAGKQVFVKCTFSGVGASFFACTAASPAATGGGSGNPVSPDDATSVPVVESDPVNVVFEQTGGTNVVADNGEPPDRVERNDATGANDDVLVDLGFSVQSTKFNVSEETISKLGATEMAIELCMRDMENMAAAAVTVLGRATVLVADVLQGETEWSDKLELGTYTHPKVVISGTTTPNDGPLDSNSQDKHGEVRNDDESATHSVAASEARISGDKDTPDGEQHHQQQTQQGSIEAKDASSGPLRYAGSTSTIRVTLATDDYTADYTVGGGSLWVEGAEITGIPEAWQLQVAAGTEHSAWNDTIAQMLAGGWGSDSCALAGIGESARSPGHHAVCGTP